MKESSYHAVTLEEREQEDHYSHSSSHSSTNEHQPALSTEDGNQTTTTTMTADDPPHPLTSFSAMIHLVKGNLGPGSLNLPHAFARTGYGLSSLLFLVVALQGIYSMRLLVYCKRTLNGPQSFMGVAEAAIGKTGSYLVEVFLVVLQGGVCCVFLSLISTNLVAITGFSEPLAILLVTAVLLGIVLLRFIQQLTWLSSTANCFMVIAIATAAIAGLVQFARATDHHRPVATVRPSTLIDFTSDMFFSFEGIGLVLPIENSYRASPGAPSFDSVLVRSMLVNASLFILVGISAGIGFPDIQSGSVTAYLEEKYPSNAWYGIVNGMVMIAVLFTFPLQLTPAMEVIDRWVAQQQDSEEVVPVAIGESEEVNSNEESDENDGIMIEEEDLDERHCGVPIWILRRWLFVAVCSLVVYSVDNLSVLIGLFGAIGQTGLAAMPCAIHLALQSRGTVSKSRWRTVIDYLILLFCGCVMLFGVASSIDEMARASP